MSTIAFRMPFGVPGDITRSSQSTVEPQAFGATAFAAYGLPVKSQQEKLFLLQLRMI